jgi:hypothetical protein
MNLYLPMVPGERMWIINGGRSGCFDYKLFGAYD